MNRNDLPAYIEKAKRRSIQFTRRINIQKGILRMALQRKKRLNLIISHIQGNQMVEQAIRAFAALDAGQALVVATSPTSATELIYGEETDDDVEDFGIYKEAIRLLLEEPIISYKVLNLRDRYIVLDGVIVALKDHNIHKVDTDT